MRIRTAIVSTLSTATGEDAENAERFLAPVELPPTVGTEPLDSSSIGVNLCVEPWNFLGGRSATRREQGQTR